MSSGLRCRIAGNEKNLRRLTVRSGGVFLFRVVVEAFRRTGVQVDLVDESGLSGCSLRLVFQTSDFPSRLGSRKLRRTG